MDPSKIAEQDLRNADRNIALYPVLKIFTKRVFLPLSAIYFMAVADFSLAEIGVLGSLYFFVNFLADVPTGLFADRKGRVASLRIAAILNICSTLLYVFVQTKFAIVIGTALEAVGYAFLSGAGEAIIHDSLEAKGKLSKYTKILSRAQSISLVINAALLALVPMTYAIDQRLPFLIGTLAYTSLLIVALLMRDMPVHTKNIVNFASLKPILKSKGIVSFALAYGLIAALYIAPSDMINIALKDLGIEPAMIGWIFSAASIFGAAFGLFFHHVKLIPLRIALLIDVIFLQVMFVAIYISSLPLLIFGFIISMAIWRFRRIFYQEKVLLKFPGKPKASLISLLHNFESIQQIWLPTVIGLVVAGFGLQQGFGIILLFSIIASIYFVFIANRFFSSGSHPVD